VTRVKKVSDCLFCRVVSRSGEDLPWHDQPLVHMPGVGAVIPGLGAFVPGYVLIFPQEHVESILEIPPSVSRQFSELVMRTTKAVSKAFGPATVFEHGSCSRAEIRRSACLDHAHLQILPGSYGLRNKALSSAALVQSDRVEAAKKLKDAGYVYLHEPQCEPIYAADPGISQFFRRAIAANLNISDEWDYLLFPRLANVRHTITGLSGLL
jgi:diadenosine tetraphosphate (Ap4A) HIT family hydrolase